MSGASANGKAERVAIRIVQRNPESVLVDAELAMSVMPWLPKGLLSLRPGADVRVAGGGTAAPRSGDSPPDRDAADPLARSAGGSNPQGNSP